MESVAVDPLGYGIACNKQQSPDPKSRAAYRQPQFFADDPLLVVYVGGSPCKVNRLPQVTLKAVACATHLGLTAQGS
jgi:hypothetical protein